MNNNFLGVVIFFIVVNVVAFSTMLFDKLQSRTRGAERISEGLLFFMAAAFGSVGVYAGMFTFRHKTQKWYFIIGIPLLIAENCASLYLLYAYASGIIQMPSL